MRNILKTSMFLVIVLCVQTQVYLNAQTPNENRDYWIETLKLINLNKHKDAINIISSYVKRNKDRTDKRELAYEAEILSIIVNYHSGAVILSTFKFTRLLKDEELSNYPKLKAILHYYNGKRLKDVSDTNGAWENFQKADELLMLENEKADVLVFKGLVGLEMSEWLHRHENGIEAAKKIDEVYHIILDMDDTKLSFIAKREILNFKATILRENRQEDQALVFVQSAIDINKRFLSEDHISFFPLIYNMAAICTKTDRYDEALIHFEKSLEIAWSNDNVSKQSLAILYNATGVVFNNKNQYGFSIILKEAANNLKHLTKSITYEDVASNYQTIATSQLLQFDTYGAWNTLKEAEKLIIENSDNEFHPRLSLIYSRMADMHNQLENWDSAIYYIDKGIDCYNKNQNNPSFFMITALNAKATALIGKKEYSLAKEILDNMNVSGKGMENAKWIRAYNYSNIALANKDYTLALQKINEALSLTFQNYQPNDIYEMLNMDKLTNVSIFYNQGSLNLLSQKVYILTKIYEDTTDDEILEHALNAVDVYISYWENNRNATLEPDVKMALQGNHQVIENCIKVLLYKYEKSKDEIYLNQAFKYANFNKGLILEDAKKSQGLILQNMGLAEEMMQLQKQVDDLKYQINSAKASYKKEQLYRRLIPLLFKQTKLYDDAKKEKILHIPIAIPSISEIQNRLKEGNVLVLFYAGKENYYSFKIDGEAVEFETILNRKEIDKIAENVYVSLSEKGDLKKLNENSHLLYQKIFKSINEQYPNGTTYEIISDGALQLIPFDVLVTHLSASDKASYLVEESAIINKNSINLSLRERTENALQIMALTPFGSKTTNEFLAYRDLDNGILSGTEKEVLALKEKYKTTHFKGKQASKKTLKERINDFSIIHLATHSIDNPTHPKMSFIALTPKSSDYDSKLFSFEIAEMDLNTEMVVLSSCYSAKGKIYQGEGAMSLARAFFVSGARSVVATKWAAADIPTSQIIQMFYANLDKGMAKSLAMQAAKKEFFINSSPLIQHPHFWGPLIVSGDDSSIVIEMAEKSSSNWHYIVGLCLFVFILPAIYLKFRSA